MGQLQKFTMGLGTFNWQAQPIRIDLPRGVNIHKITVFTSAGLTVTDPGGAAAGTLLGEGPQRLIRSMRIVHDGVDQGIMDGRWGHQLYLRSGLEVITGVYPANAAAQVATAISAYAEWPFERPWLANPFDTVWSGKTPVARDFALIIEPETAASAAGSAQGTGAVITGGTMVETWSTLPSFTVEVEYSTNAINPWRVPRYFVYNTDPIAAANAALSFSLRGLPEFDSVLFRYLLDTNNVPQANGIANFTFQVSRGATRYYGGPQSGLRVPYLVLQERKMFPAVNDDATNIGTTGTFFLPFTDKGRLSTTVEPAALNLPEFVFNVAAPGAGTARIDMLVAELHDIPGVTRPKL